MVFLCPACLNMFRTVLPERFGARFEFECEYFVTWLWRRMEAGQVKITNPLDRPVAVHDSCHGRRLGDEVMEQTRALYRRLGLALINPSAITRTAFAAGSRPAATGKCPRTIVAVGRGRSRGSGDRGAGDGGLLHRLLPAPGP